MMYEYRYYPVLNACVHCTLYHVGVQASPSVRCACTLYIVPCRSTGTTQC